MTRTSMNRRRVLATAAAAALAGGTAWRAAAQVPASARILVGFAPGGGADLLGRLLAERLGPALGGGGVRVVVDNRPGGAGKVAVDALKASPPDGATLLLAPLVTPVLSQLTFRNPGYDAGRDFTPVGLVGHFQFALAVAASHPAKSVPEFVAWLQANRDKANFGSPSPGSLPHFFGVLLGQAIGVDLVHVAYRGGAPMLNDLVAGQITSGIDTELELGELHRAGKVRILGVFAARRLPQLPEVPTFAELGYRDATGSGWYSLWASATAPPVTVLAWNRALGAVLAQPAVKEQFARWGLEAETGPPHALERFRLAEIEKWRPVIAASGFKAD